MMRVIFIAGILISWFGIGSQALAHEVRPTIFSLQFNATGQFTLTADTNLESLVAGIGAGHEDTDDAPEAQLYNQLRLLPPPEMASRFLGFSDEWITNLGLTFSTRPADMKLESILVPQVGDVASARQSIVTLTGVVPEFATTLRWAYPEKYGSSVLRIERPDQELQARFYGAGAVSDEIAIGLAQPRSWFEKFVDYGVIGFTHIIPKGLDHILFVLGLFLLNANWKPLLLQVTAFTIAHSVTLALGLYGLVSVPPSIVEPLIALSIIYVAVENIFTNRLHAWRPVIVFAFGLLHGLGFAGILAEIGLPRPDFVLGLVAFNVGVELGQLAVIALAFGAVGWFAAKPWYRQIITTPASVAIAAMGAWWFVERTMLPV